MTTPLKCPITNTQCHEGCKCDDADEFICMLDEDGSRRWPLHWERALDMSDFECRRAMEQRPGASLLRKGQGLTLINNELAVANKPSNPLLEPLAQCIFAIESVVYLNATINKDAKNELWKYACNARQRMEQAGYSWPDGIGGVTARTLGSDEPAGQGDGKPSPDAGQHE